MEILPTEKKVCMFTGHRSLGEDFFSEELLFAIDEKIAAGYTDFLCGMAVGFDLLAAEFVLMRKVENPNLRLIACLPCKEQDKYFSKEDKARYRNALDFADEVVLLSESYYRGCMHVRDEYMANRADCAVTYCKKQQGGTAYTVRYLHRRFPQKEILFL